MNIPNSNYGFPMPLTASLSSTITSHDIPLVTQNPPGVSIEMHASNFDQNKFYVEEKISTSQNPSPPTTLITTPRAFDGHETVKLTSLPKIRLTMASKKESQEETNPQPKISSSSSKTDHHQARLVYMKELGPTIIESPGSVLHKSSPYRIKEFILLQNEDNVYSNEEVHKVFLSEFSDMATTGLGSMMTPKGAAGRSTSKRIMANEESPSTRLKYFYKKRSVEPSSTNSSRATRQQTTLGLDHPSLFNDGSSSIRQRLSGIVLFLIILSFNIFL